MDSSKPRFSRRSYDRAAIEALAAKYRTWGRWGADDERGSVNYVSPDKIATAAQLIRRGTVFSLSLPLDRLGPMRGGGPRVNPQHVMLRTPHDPIPGRNDGGLQRSADNAVYMPLQCSTQWDAFCHIFYDGRTYNGHGYDSITTLDGAAHNSISHMKDRTVGRGVLLDVARHFGREALDPGESIQLEDLEECAAGHGVEIGEGDFVLVRTGHLERRRNDGDWADFAGGPAPGLGVSCAEFLCERRVAAVATDTWGVEAMPYEIDQLMAPLHAILLVNAGVLLGEMWDLQSLAEDCADDGIYEFFLSAPPLNVTGSTGSPLNPLAIK